MTVDRLRSWLLEHPVLRNLAPSHVALVTGCAAIRETARDERIFRRGEAATEVALLRCGKLVFEMQATPESQAAIVTFGAGDAVPWAWMTRGYHWPADGEAVQSSELIVLDAGCLRRKCRAVPSLGYELAKRFFDATRAEHLVMRDR